MVDGPILTRSENGVIRDHLDVVIEVIEAKVAAHTHARDAATNYRERRRHLERLEGDRASLRVAKNLRTRYQRN